MLIPSLTKFHSSYGLWVITVLGPAAIAVQTTDPDQTTDPEARVAELVEPLRGLGDWDDEAALIENYLDRLWREQDWSEEPDIFARDLVKEVGRIPPWNVPGRVSKLTELVQNRYDLDERQHVALTGQVYGQMFGFMFRNAGTISSHIAEAVKTRVEGQPYTPEQVAKWMREGEPLNEDAGRIMNEVMKSFERGLNPRQREIFERDRKRLLDRQRYFDEMRESWLRGEWKPEDWGLENDPVQLGQMRSASGPGGGAAPFSQRCLSYDETSWDECVADFIQLYSLDPSQTRAAQSILAELADRAAQYREQRSQRLNEVSVADRLENEQWSPFRAMFEELTVRLHRIPTSGQRSVAHPQPAPEETRTTTSAPVIDDGTVPPSQVDE